MVGSSTPVVDPRGRISVGTPRDRITDYGGRITDYGGRITDYGGRITDYGGQIK